MLSENASPDQAVENKTFEETLSGAMDPTDSKAAVSIFEVRVILISALNFFSVWDGPKGEAGPLLNTLLSLRVFDSGSNSTAATTNRLSLYPLCERANFTTSFLVS